MQCTEPFLRRRIFSENMGDGKIRFCHRYKSHSKYKAGRPYPHREVQPPHQETHMAFLHLSK